MAAPKWKSFIGPAIGLACVVLFYHFFLKDYSFEKLWAPLRNANLFYLAIGISLNLLSFVFRAIRWKYLIEPIQKTRHASRLLSTIYSFTISNIFPARVGEFARAIALNRKEGVPFTAGFATVVMERVFDMLAILLFFIGTLLFINFPRLPPTSIGNMEIDPTAWFQGTGWAMLAATAVFVLCLALLKMQPKRFVRWFSSPFSIVSGKLADKIKSLLESFETGLEVLRSAGQMAKTTAWSILLWLEISLSAYFTIKALDLNVSYGGAIFIIVILAFGVALPQAPGFIGVFHVAAAVGLQILGVEAKEMIPGAAIVLHAVAYFPVTILGIILLSFDNLSLKDLRSRGDSGSPGAE